MPPSITASGAKETTQSRVSAGDQNECRELYRSRRTNATPASVRINEYEAPRDVDPQCDAAKHL